MDPLRDGKILVECRPLAQLLLSILPLPVLPICAHGAVPLRRHGLISQKRIYSIQMHLSNPQQRGVDGVQRVVRVDLEVKKRMSGTLSIHPSVLQVSIFPMISHSISEWSNHLTDFPSFIKMIKSSLVIKQSTDSMEISTY